MFAVTVHFSIDPGRWDDFMALMLENAERSRREEPGCRQFDVCIDAARPGSVFLYELYDDAAAFDAHLGAPHYKAFAAATASMVRERAIARWQRCAP
jgi:quinol monooxygenase YgiN